MKTNRKINAVLLLTLFTSILSGCAPKSEPPGNNDANGISDTIPVNTRLSGKIVIEGSTSMQKIFQELGDAFQEKNNKVSVEYIGNGSSSGIKAAIEGSSDFGAASRAIREDEMSRGLQVITVAEDAIVVIVNPTNGVKRLTGEQISKIYKKEITNWKDVGGKNSPIVVVARDAASGTREAFETVLGIKDLVKADQEAAKTGEVKTLISQNSNAIGYISLAYLDGMVRGIEIDGKAATAENVMNGSYTVKRPFNLVKKGRLDDLEKAFIDFIFSEEGAEIISKESIPVKRGRT